MIDHARNIESKKYLNQRAAICMLISNNFRDFIGSHEGKSEIEQEFKEKAYNIICDENELENCNDVQFIEKIPNILIKI